MSGQYIRESFGSVSIVKQGVHSFYSLTLPSDVLARTCFVISREDDQDLGFQRRLDRRRAAEIAEYIDTGLGTIPSSIVLSAQQEANLEYISKTKTIKFDAIPKAFMIIDGQHRVYGFSIAKSLLRIPVVIYDGLSKRDETRLFIDINSKQKGVPPELLLDIKKMAEYESTQEEFLRMLFDLFCQNSNSALYGKLSPSARKRGFLTRANFNAAVKPLVKFFSAKDVDDVFNILNNYFVAFGYTVLHDDADDVFSNPTVFKAICAFFTTVAAKVKDRYGSIYSVDNFGDVLAPMHGKSRARLKSAGNAYKPIADYLEECLAGAFTL